MPIEAMVNEVQSGDSEITEICDAVAKAFPGEQVVLSLIEEAQSLLADRSGSCSVQAAVSCTNFCAQTIRDKAFFELVDARRDGRFANHPMVTGEPHLVYYAGVPLELDDGFVPGALSLVGTTEREKLNANEVETLHLFAQRISRVLEDLLNH